MSGYLIIDTETTDLVAYDKAAEHPDQPRVAEVAMIFTDDEFNEQERHHSLIVPDGWDTISPEAFKTNGLTIEELTANGRPILDALRVYTRGILGEDRAVISYGAQFDCKMMRRELFLAGEDKLFEVTRNICLMRSAQSAKLRIIKRDWEKPGYPPLEKQRGWPKKDDVLAHFGLPAPEPMPHRAIAGAECALLLAREINAIGKLLPAAVHYSKNHEEISANV